MPAKRNPEITKADEPFETINLMEVPVAEIDTFVADWKRRSKLLENVKGFIDDSLEKSLLKGSKYTLINISRWSSYNAWLDATNNPDYAAKLAVDQKEQSHTGFVNVVRGFYRPVASSTHVYK